MIAEFLSNYITQFISSIGYLGVFILMTLESAALPVPSEVVMPFSGYLSYRGVFDLTLITIVGAAGCMAGSVISYYVGLKGGRPFLAKYGKYFFINYRHVEHAENWFNKYGDKAVFFSRLFPVVRTFISLPAGIAKYSLKKLTLYSFLGSLPWCFGLAYIGFRLGPYWMNIIRFFNGLDIVIVVILILCAFYFWKIKK
jgi:membrane protein DedA with SNARE-associated domain